MVSFDYGPRDARDRAARWLYANTLGPNHTDDRMREWTTGRFPTTTQCRGDSGQPIY